MCKCSKSNDYNSVSLLYTCDVKLMFICQKTRNIQRSSSRVVCNLAVYQAVVYTNDFNTVHSDLHCSIWQGPFTHQARVEQYFFEAVQTDRLTEFTCKQSTGKLLHKLSKKKVTVSHIHLSHKTHHLGHDKFCNQNLQLPFKSKNVQFHNIFPRPQCAFLYHV